LHIDLALDEEEEDMQAKCAKTPAIYKIDNRNINIIRLS